MSTSALPTLVVISTMLLACSDSRLTGPQAQAVYTLARSQEAFIADTLIVVVDGRRISDHNELDGLDPKQIRSVELIKGEPARRLYGDSARRGVILIRTMAVPDSGTENGR